jgi:hypothetical protein
LESIKRQSMIEVFKTNIQEKAQSDEVKKQVLKHYPKLLIGFDLEDIDKVLRVEGSFFISSDIIELIVSSGFECEVMI